MKKKHIAFLISSIVVLEILVGTSLFFFFWRKGIHEKSPIVQIASRSAGVYSLPQDVLQGLLSLTPVEKEDLSALDLEELQKRIELCPAIKQARVRTLAPHTLVVDYTLREPIFRLGGYHNVAVDPENTAFPLEPYFPNMWVPTLFVSSTEQFSSCLEIVRECSRMGLILEEIDAVDMDALGLFRREIRLKAHSRELSIRLPVDGLSLSLQRLSLILKRYPEYSGTIDLRFPNVGYLEQFFQKGAHGLPVQS